MNYFFCAGEASGDIHAAQVIEQLLKIDPDAGITFLGGDEMARAVGHEPLIHYKRMAYMGFIDVVAHLPEVLGNLREAKAAIRAARPDAVVLVDYPGFNLKLAKFAKRLGIKVFYYIAPKLWAWKEYRIRQLRDYCDGVFSILPFEPEWFAGKGLTVTYVGNPSVEEVERAVAMVPSRADFLHRYGLAASRPILALVPGSRGSEIRTNLPVMDAVARRHPEMQPVVAGAPSMSARLYRQFTDFPVIFGGTLALMAQSRAAMVTSGTASLECALARCPQVVCYRNVGWKWAAELFRHILKVPFATLPNLVAGGLGKEKKREQDRRAKATGVRGCVVPELLVNYCTPELVDRELTPLLLDGSERQAQVEGYDTVRRMLHTDEPAAVNVARLLHQALTPK